MRGELREKGARDGVTTLTLSPGLSASNSSSVMDSLGVENIIFAPKTKLSRRCRLEGFRERRHALGSSAISELRKRMFQVIYQAGRRIKVEQK